MTSSRTASADPLVTVIMPAFNAGLYVLEAVRSVQMQTWKNWELIVVNDGSTDDTGVLLEGIRDPRVQVFHQTNDGIGSARNRGLERAKGDFICFLDADDTMPPRGLGSRVAVLLADPSLSFADGVVNYYDRDMRRVWRTYTPCFTGYPFDLLLRFDPCCFFGNTWMIRRDALGEARFNESISHVEDLLLYLNIAHGKRYGYTEETVLHYRITGSSTMSRLEGLERSYHVVHRWMRAHPELVPRRSLWVAGYRIRRMMSGAYWHAKRPWPAVFAWFR